MEVLRSLGFASAAPLGQGAYGQVFKCNDHLGTDLAVKVSTDPRARTAASREAAVMSLVPPHPNVLPLHSFSTTEHASVLATPLANAGDTLRHMQSRQCKPLSVGELHALFSQLVDAVEHLHTHGIVHRDIKCENILLADSGARLVLGDFGFAARFRAGAKSLNEAWGSLHYSSPEICAHESYEGPEVDVWSMGVVLFAWATGRLPFGGADECETSRRIIAGTFAIPAFVPNDLAALIEGMLEVDPTRRLTLAAIRANPWVAAWGHHDAAATAGHSTTTPTPLAPVASKKRHAEDSYPTPCARAATQMRK